MDPGVMGEWFAELAAALFKGDREEASAFLSCQPLLLTESERLRPLVRLLTEELKATLPQASRNVLWVFALRNRSDRRGHRRQVRPCRSLQYEPGRGLLARGCSL